MDNSIFRELSNQKIHSTVEAMQYRGMTTKGRRKQKKRGNSRGWRSQQKRQLHILVRLFSRAQVSKTASNIPFLFELPPPLVCCVCSLSNRALILHLIFLLGPPKSCQRPNGLLPRTSCRLLLQLSVFSPEHLFQPLQRGIV